MTLFNKKVLLAELQDRTELLQSSLAPFIQLSEKALNFKPAKNCWSIAQVFEHLNLTHEIYLPSIEKKLIGQSKCNKASFKSSWLGDWLYRRILPRQDGSIFKMKAPVFLQAASVTLNGKEALHKLAHHLEELRYVIEQADHVDIRKIKIPIFSFSRLLTMRLGDQLRFLVAHNERHLLQANKVLQLLQSLREQQAAT